MVFNKLSDQMTGEPGLLNPIGLKAELRTGDITVRNKVR